jgi:hypothetical protein
VSESPPAAPFSSGGLCFIPNVFFRTQKFMFGLSPVPHRVKMFAGGSVWRQTLSGRRRQTTPARPENGSAPAPRKGRVTVIHNSDCYLQTPSAPKYLILHSIPTFPFHPHRSCGGVFFSPSSIDSIDCLDVGF